MKVKDSPGSGVIHIWRTIYRRLSQCITNKSLFVKISPDPPPALTDFMHPAMHTSTSSFGVISEATMGGPLNLICHDIKMEGEWDIPPKSCVCVPLCRRYSMYAWCSGHGQGALPAPLPDAIQVVLFHTFFMIRKCFPDKFSKLSLTNEKFSCPCRLDLMLQ